MTHLFSHLITSVYNPHIGRSPLASQRYNETCWIPISWAGNSNVIWTCIFCMYRELVKFSTWCGKCEMLPVQYLFVYSFHTEVHMSWVEPQDLFCHSTRRCIHLPGLTRPGPGLEDGAHPTPEAVPNVRNASTKPHVTYNSPKVTVTSPWIPSNWALTLR